MKILVTGGTGVVGKATVDALVARGHTVRLFSRHAQHDVEEWPHRVEPFAGNAGEPSEVRGAADGCEVVIHLAAIVAESPPEVTFENVNVHGTRHIVDEAERAEVRRFVYVSSLGADRGESPYHRSKLRGEEIARTFGREWLIIRPGNVYGSGDEQISLLLQMVRSLPAVPVIAGGDRPFQPIWSEDLGLALAEAAEREDLHHRVLEIAGPEVTTYDDVVNRLIGITARDPVKIPVPAAMASLALKAAGFLGADVPVDSGQLTMLGEGNVVTAPEGNALATIFGIRGTPLDEGFRKLADAQPEQLPDEGVGALARKRFWADIGGTGHTPESLFSLFVSNFAEITPWQIGVGAEPGSTREPEKGAMLTLVLPMRGHVQVKVVELEPRRMTVVTIAGHPLAGAVRFLSEARGSHIRFEIQVYDRASNPADWLVMNPIGARLQNATWRQTIERVVEAAGGEAMDGVKQDTTKLDEQQAAEINEWLDDLVMAQRREDHEVRDSGVAHGQPADVRHASRESYVEHREHVREGREPRPDR